MAVSFPKARQWKGFSTHIPSPLSARKRAVELGRILSQYDTGAVSSLWIAILQRFKGYPGVPFLAQITLMRRFMMRIGTEQPKKNAYALITGDKLGPGGQPNDEVSSPSRSDKHAHLQAPYRDGQTGDRGNARIGTYETSISPMMTAVLCLFEKPPGPVSKLWKLKATWTLQDGGRSGCQTEYWSVKKTPTVFFSFDSGR